ncbi:hypothetical protein C8R42DRAFT_644438 [Lentinula raphanica]|nr:hypothetical protein C8R42DRAFT_644438 [Lentinula raphanica]
MSPATPLPFLANVPEHQNLSSIYYVQGNGLGLTRKSKEPYRRALHAGDARMLTDVPVEVVYLKIFCYLDPQDLLSLSRTCKRLREILFSKTIMEVVWRTARLNIQGNLPPLPEDLNEPQMRLLWQILEMQYSTVETSSEILSRLFDYLMEGNSFRIFDWRSLHDELYPLTAFEIISKEKVRIPGKAYDVFIIDNQKLSDLKAEFAALESEEHRHSWLNQKRREQTAIVQHASLCEAWYKGQPERRSAQLITLRTNRLEAILGRLDVVGLRREAEIIIGGRSNLKDPKEFKDLSCVKQPTQLTDRGWALIKSKLIEMLSEHRIKRLAQQNYSRLREEYAKFLSCQDLRDIYPGLGDVLTDPVVEASIWDTDPEEGLTPLSLQTLLSQFLERFLGDWRQSKKEELLVILRKARPTAILSDLSLATTIFGCAMYDQEGPWSSSSLFFHSDSSQFAQEILFSAGLDPATATVGDLTLAQPVIECTGSQAEFFHGRLFVTWPAALTYNLTVDHENHFVINRFGDETSGIRAREPLSMFSKAVCCADCHAELTPKSFIRHLNVVHGLVYSIDSAGFYLLHGSHWYWNPRENLHSIGMDFRW